LGAGGQILIIYSLGHTFDFSLFAAQLGSFLPLLILGPLSEEIGWRGYALDRLQTRWNSLTSSLIVGMGWGLWHLPLFFMVGTSQHELAFPFVGFLVGTMANSVLFTWLHNNTSRSIWTAIFFHWIFTYAAQVVGSGVTRSALYNWLEYVPYIIVAIVIMMARNPQLLQINSKNS
jgi:membrane protease YdiL (CAAX protease family)